MPHRQDVPVWKTIGRPKPPWRPDLVLGEESYRKVREIGDRIGAETAIVAQRRRRQKAMVLSLLAFSVIAVLLT